MNKNGKASFLVIVIIGVVALFALGIIKLPQGSISTEDNTPVNPNPNYQPTASYATFDKFGTASISGTAYYKITGLPAQTTAYANVVPGQEYNYWLSSTVYYVKPLTFTAETGVNDNVNKYAVGNGTISITGYNNVDNCALTAGGGACNISQAASTQGNVKFTFLGGAKNSSVPFGGLLVLEVNSSVSSVTCSGDGIVGPNSKYQLTYALSALTNTYYAFELKPGFDVSINNGNSGVIQYVNCMINTGTTAVAASSTYYLKLIPANYYLGNDGNFYLDTEQKMNGAVTRTGIAYTPTFTFYTK